MCHQFQPLPQSVVEDVARQMAAGTLAATDYAVNQLELSEGEDTAGGNSLFPGDTATVIVGDPMPAPINLTWGFTVAWSKQPVFNTRIETACDPASFWADALEKRRCIVPVLAFFETHRSETTLSAKTRRRVKRPYRFASAQGRVLYLAGIYGSGCFSLVTTEPDSVVGAVHDRSPLALTAEGAETWLKFGHIACSEARRAALEATPAGVSGAAMATDSQQLSLF